MISRSKTNVVGIKDVLKVGSFTYKLTKEHRAFLKENRDREDLAYKYLIYKINQNSKGFDNCISLNEFSKLYVKSKKVNDFKDLESYSNKIVLEEVYKLLKFYLEWLKEQDLTYTYFKNCIDPSQKIKIEFGYGDKVLVKFISNLSTIKKYNEGFDIIIGEKYNYLELVYKILGLHFYPEEDEIFKICRSVNGEYYSASSILWGKRHLVFKSI